jgi:hypothetical protein
MSVTEKRKEQALIVLLAVFCVSIFANFLPNRQPIIVYVPDSKVQNDPRLNLKDEIPPVNLLTSKPAAFQAIKRNIFQFEAEPVSPAEDESEMQTDNTEMTSVATQPSVPDVKYLGFYREKSSSSKRLGAISDEGQIYVGGVGDTLNQEYVVLQISKESVVLKALSSGKIFRFPLGKNGQSPTELKNYTQLPVSN